LGFVLRCTHLDREEGGNEVTIKIEKKLPQRAINSMLHGNWHDFLVTIKALKVGESFVFPDISSNHRLIMAAMPVLFGSYFRTAKEGRQFRIGRVK
jgi:hypothetical protein